MSNIQMRNVPEELHEAARQRAQQLGVDLSTYLRELLERDIRVPAGQDWIKRSLEQPRMKGPYLDPVQLIREAREERDRKIMESIGVPYGVHR